ncbi:ribonuclease III [Dyella nitratireducens]|uniref:Ribonuclease 3 n=1 Tax=Dyella nitratireducens TaxID=1849580 RepID=A0ABQ1FL15_9GAMM|nr:ribonuclease III [Dyella nitratireducens]GGA17392.1 ribonuclease 3 [Dyella nitratireducens]GLQ44795.1 ribonuclease 3 [Dyella nitratireducens]
MQFPYHFRDPSLAELALTHRSAGKPNNERMEFLGDALLGAIIAEMLYETHPKAAEGDMSRLRAQLVNGQALAVVARELELGDQLKLGSGELKSGGFRRDSILADAFEALIAAIYLDGGFDACRTTVRTLFAERLAALPHASKDAKTRLQEWLQGQGLPLPQYELVATEGEEHARIFEVHCMVSQPMTVTESGRGSSRRLAEQDAAEMVLSRLAGVQEGQ